MRPRTSRPAAERRAAFTAALAGLLAGCALQPPPSGPELARDALGTAEPPPAWTAAGAGEGPVEAGWVETFGDPQLPALVAEAIAANPDLRGAAALVEQAAAYVRIAGGSAYPNVSVVGRTSTDDGSGTAPLNAGILQASWELDVWGRVRYGRRAAEDQYAAATADFAYARESLAAVVVRAYVTATEATLQRELAADALVGAERLLGLVADRQRVGSASQLDVALARANYEGLRDSVRRLDLAIEQSRRALELLLGRYPSAEIAASRALPAVAGPAPAGVPSELLERRPDVVAAANRVAAAFDRTGEAKAARLPQLTLTASGSYLSSDVLVLQERTNPVWGLGLGLVMPLYAGGALKAQVELRTAEQRAAVAAFASTGLRAFGEVESALAAERAAADREQILDAQVRENERALELENVRYRVGRTDLRTVTQQQLAVYASRSSLLRVRADRALSRVSLYLALGGGFARDVG